MSGIPKKLILVGSVLLLGLAGGLLWANRPTEDRGFVDLEALNKALEEDLASEGVVQIDDSSEFAAALEAIPAGLPPGLPEPDDLPPGVQPLIPSEEVHRSMLDMIEGLLVRLNAVNPSAYVDWVRSRDHSLIDEFTLREIAEIGWPYIFNTEAPDDLEPIELFKKLHRGYLEHADGQVRPAAVSLDDQGARIRYLRFSEGAWSASPQSIFLYLNYEKQRWLGYSASSTRQLWIPPLSIEEVAARHGFVNRALVTIGLQTASGEWLPTIIASYYDPDDEEWYIETIAFVNVTSIASTWMY